MDDEEIQARINELSKRLQRLSEEEARSALVGGPAARGGNLAAKAAILKEIERLMDEWEKGPEKKD